MLTTDRGSDQDQPIILAYHIKDVKKESSKQRLELITELGMPGVRHLLINVKNLQLFEYHSIRGQYLRKSKAKKILHQSRKDVFCVYVMRFQKRQSYVEALAATN